MNLSDLRSRSSSPPLEEPSAAPDVPSFPPVEPTATEGSSSGVGGTGEEQASADVASPAPEVFGVSEALTPSGIEIYYQAGPKRLYRIRNTMPKGTYDVPWVDVPSMSELLSIYDKPGLPWWGMKIGVEGVQTLMREEPTGERWNELAGMEVDEIVALLTKHKLTVNHVRDKAGDRGQDVHDALELWAAEQILPNPEVFGPDKSGYVQGLKQFVIDSGAEPLSSEVMVASTEWKFAGRYDLGSVIPDGARVVTKSYPKKKSVVEPLPGGTWMLDLKTSKGVYETHHIQLAGYNLASEECYGTRYDHTGVIHVFEDGRYELVMGRGTDDDFANTRAAYDTMQRLKGKKR